MNAFTTVYEYPLFLYVRVEQLIILNLHVLS